MDHNAYWKGLTWACLGTGDLPGALKAIQVLRDREPDVAGPNRATVANQLLRDATIARLRGEREESADLIREARWVRDELVAGMEEEWSRTRFASDFDTYESIALGR